MTDRGVTLIEILVALTVLAIGAVAISAWQLTLLRVAVATRELNRVLLVAETELQQRLLASDSGASCDETLMPPGTPLECEALVEACTVSGSELLCGPTGGTFPERITVRAASTAEGGPEVIISALRDRR